MKLFYAPGACSVGIHFLLEEIGKPYETARIDLTKEAQLGADYVQVNPKSKVPALQRDDGSVLTEFPAIAFWLAKMNPDAALLPSGTEGEVRALEMIDYAVSTIHMQGFSRIFRAAKFSPTDADHEAVRENGRALVRKGFENVSKTLAVKPFILGDRLSIADGALFYVLFWAIDRVKMALPDNCASYYGRLKSRPSAARVFEAEGIVLR